MDARYTKIFLLSPANMSGVRAQQLISPQSRFAMGRSFRSAEGVRIEEAFCFMSSLYFRGKLAYARRFVFTPGASPSSRIFIIAPGFGLVSPDWKLTAQRTQIMQHVRVAPKDSRFRAPLEDQATELKAALDEGSQIILLGSIASGKYVDILWPIFGDRLLVPRSFVGIGDMSRGALLLRSVANGDELEYMTVDPATARRLAVSRPHHSAARKILSASEAPCGRRSSDSRLL